MADAPHRPEDVHEPERSATQDPGPGMPRWVKVFVAIGVIVVIVLVVALVTGGNHGPGRHFGAEPSRSTPSAVFHANGAHPRVGRSPSAAGSHTG